MSAEARLKTLFLRLYRENAWSRTDAAESLAKVYDALEWQVYGDPSKTQKHKAYEVLFDEEPTP